MRPRGLPLSMSTADDDGWGDEAEGVEEEVASQVMTKKKKKGGELDDIMSEVAARGNDQPIVVPRNAGVKPMAPGPIKPDPIEGMDGESARRKRLFLFTVFRARHAFDGICRTTPSS